MFTHRPVPVFTLLTLIPILLFLGACEKKSAPPVAQNESPVVIGTSIAFESDVLNQTRHLVVHLPAGYEQGNQDYPVLYLVDGGVQQDFIPMAGMEALASLSGQYRPFILVGVQTENRYHELTALSTVEYDLEMIPDNGGAKDFRRHLLEEVKPWVKARYRTSGEDGIIGESLAGLFIAETFLRTPDSFTHYISVSPSLWWLDMGLSKEAAGLLQDPDFPSDRSFYLTVASEGGAMLEGVERLNAALENHAPRGLQWWYQPMPDEHHHTIYNPATLRALRLVFAPEES